jgi:signal transduction histidine kinase
VRSSLENLKPAPDNARVYIERAEEGLKRLSTILTRMSEATRLEQSLASVERERYDLAAVVGGCVEGYRLAYPGQGFELDLPGSPAMVSGSPDLAAQLLDKLAANAADFSSQGEPVRVSLSVAAATARLRVANQGPPLPEPASGNLFDSMVSIRADRGAGEPHLGLGLYVARLIAEFHGGAIGAENLASGRGVAVTATFRLA